MRADDHVREVAGELRAEDLRRGSPKAASRGAALGVLAELTAFPGLLRLKPPHRKGGRRFSKNGNPDKGLEYPR